MPMQLLDDLNEFQLMIKIPYLSIFLWKALSTKLTVDNG
jgi:hypothetical protein